MSNYEKGDQVEWDWGEGTACGRIETIYTRKTTRTIKGAKVTRKASADEPAFYTKQDDGDRVLKSHTEVRKA